MHELGIEVLTVYASTENWKRPKAKWIILCLCYLSNAEQELAAKRCNKIIGDLSSFSDEIREQINKTEKLTENTGMVLNIALNYGGDEIVNAVRAIVKSGVPADSVNEDTG